VRCCLEDLVARVQNGSQLCVEGGVVVKGCGGVKKMSLFFSGGV